VRRITSRAEPELEGDRRPAAITTGYATRGGVNRTDRRELLPASGPGVDVEPVLGVADAGRAVGDRGVLVDLEEVGRAQVVVALGASTSSPWTVVMWPRTLLTIMWRTVKATSEWPGSS
jgi:hypothetical protein